MDDQRRRPSVLLVSTYDTDTNSSRSEQLAGDIVGHQPEQFIDNSFSSQRANSSPANRQQQQQQAAARSHQANRLDRRRSTISKSVFDAFIGVSKSNWLLTYLLGAGLVTTIFNTLLLSFIVKSLQQNGDAGYMNGQIVWQDVEPMGLSGSLLRLPTRLAAGKSIALRAIRWSTPRELDSAAGSAGQSASPSPLKLEIDDSLELASGESHSFLLAAGTGSVASSGQAASVNYEIGADETRDNDSDNDSDKLATRGAKSNYLAVNANNDAVGSKLARRLEFGATKRFVLELRRSKEEDNDDDDQDDGGKNRETKRSNGRKKQRRKSHLETKGMRLFEFDGDEQSISLASETQLKLDRVAPSASSGGRAGDDAIVEIDDTLNADSEITGLLGNDLEVQVRNGSLDGRSVGRVRLVSRSGGIQLTSYHCVEFIAPMVQLNAKRLYLERGIRYFDSYDFTSPETKQGKSSGNKMRRHSHPAGQSASAQSPIRAYNLVEANGLLMAA